MSNQIKIKQVRSTIRTKPKQRQTMEALGLRGINKTVVHNDTPSVKGMIKVVSHLVEVEEQK